MSLRQVSLGNSSRIVGLTRAIFSETVCIILADHGSYGRVRALDQRSTQRASEELERDASPGMYPFSTNYGTGRPH